MKENIGEGIVNRLFFMVVVVLILPFILQAKDLGFRYQEGRCIDKNGQEGLNPTFFGPCADFRGLDIKGVRFDDIDFSGSKFDSGNLNDVDFSYSKLIGASFQNTIIKAADFGEADLSGSNFQEAVIEESTFFGATLKNANFTRASIKNGSFAKVVAVSSIFNQVIFENVIFESSDFSFSELKMADLSRQKLKRINFSHANFTGATLKHVSFSFCNLSQVGLDNALLQHADFSNSTLIVSSARGAKFNTNTKFSFSKDEAERLGMILILLAEFSGIQSKIPIEDLNGWKICHTSTYASTTSISFIQQQCPGQVLMLGCRKTGGQILELAAYGRSEMVWKDVGEVKNAFTLENGVRFYYSPNLSMGFAPENVEINRNSCDVDGDLPEFRMCIHTKNGSIESGYRCGNNDLNGSEDFERVFLVPER